MNNLNYIDKTGAVGTFENVWNVASGKAQPIGFFTAVKRTFFGEFLVNITEVKRGYRLSVSVPPEKGTICCPVTYCLVGWECVPNLAQAEYVAHRFIARKRTERIEQYKARLSLYKPHRA